MLLRRHRLDRNASPPTRAVYDDEQFEVLERGILIDDLPDHLVARDITDGRP